MSRSKQVTLSLAANTPTPLISTIGPGWGIRVQSVLIATSGEADISFYDDDTPIGGPFTAPVELGFPEGGLFRTGMGGDLFIQASASVSAQITILYVDEPYIPSYNPLYINRPAPQPEVRPLSVPDLFIRGARGVWWDVQDLSTLWADTEGIIPAQVDGLVARHDDKSGHGWHRIQATEGNRPTLRQDATGKYYLDYSGGATLLVPGSTERFPWLHDGTGCTVAAFGNFPNDNTTRQWLISHPNTPNQTGFRWIRSSTTTQPWSVQINRGEDASRTATTSMNRVSMSAIPRMFLHTYGEDEGLSMGVDRCLDREEVATANAPSGGGNTGLLGNHSLFNGFEYEVIMVDRVLSEGEVAQLYQHCRENNLNIPPAFDYTLLLGGQSNQVGIGSITDTLPEDKMDGCYSWTRAEEIQLTSIPEHSILNRPIATDPDHGSPAAPRHGFSMQVQKHLKAEHDLNTIIVPCAIGSTSIQQWDTLETIDDRTTMIGAMKYRYGQASLKGGTPVIIYSGHENNAINAEPDYINGGVGDVYQERLTTWFTHIRNEIVGNPDTPIIFVQLGSSFVENTALTYAAGAEAQRQVEASLPNAYMVVAMDVERNASPDDIHVSRAGNTTLAERISLAFREHILKEEVNGTGPRIESSEFSGDTLTLTLTRDINTTSGDYGNLFRVYSEGDEMTVVSANRHNVNSDQITIVCSSPLVAPVTLTYGYRVGPNAAARTDIVVDDGGLPLPTFGPILVSEAS